MYERRRNPLQGDGPKPPRVVERTFYPSQRADDTTAKRLLCSNQRRLVLALLLLLCIQVQAR